MDMDIDIAVIPDDDHLTVDNDRISELDPDNDRLDDPTADEDEATMSNSLADLTVDSTLDWVRPLGSTSEPRLTDQDQNHSWPAPRTSPGMLITNRSCRLLISFTDPEVSSPIRTFTEDYPEDATVPDNHPVNRDTRLVSSSRPQLMLPSELTSQLPVLEQKTLKRMNPSPCEL